jgi:predicted transcriptional regulator YheO
MAHSDTKKNDALIINAFKSTVEALAAYLGKAFEIVLHDLSDLDHSIVKIVNGCHSGRKEGAPITDMALAMLDAIEKDKSERYRVYYSKNKHGKPVKSTTVAIFGENDRVIGLMCVNFYLDSPFSAILDSFGVGDAPEYVVETFINDSDELVAAALKTVKEAVSEDARIMVSQKNREIITQLYNQGIFKLKNAVKLVSEDLGISKNTVYMHLRRLGNAA